MIRINIKNHGIIPVLNINGPRTGINVSEEQYKQLQAYKIEMEVIEPKRINLKEVKSTIVITEPPVVSDEKNIHVSELEVLTPEPVLDKPLVEIPIVSDELNIPKPIEPIKKGPIKIKVSQE